MDILSTTFFGYTEYLPKLAGSDFQLLEKLVKTYEILVIREVGIHALEHAKKMLDLGALPVVMWRYNKTKPNYLIIFNSYEE